MTPSFGGRPWARACPELVEGDPYSGDIKSPARGSFSGRTPWSGSFGVNKRKVPRLGHAPSLGMTGIEGETWNRRNVSRRVAQPFRAADVYPINEIWGGGWPTQHRFRCVGRKFCHSYSDIDSNESSIRTHATSEDRVSD